MFCNINGAISLCVENAVSAKSRTFAHHLPNTTKIIGTIETMCEVRKETIREALRSTQEKWRRTRGEQQERIVGENGAYVLTTMLGGREYRTLLTDTMIRESWDRALAKSMQP